MSIIKLSSGYTTIPEGTYIFKITKVNYDEKFGKLDVEMTTEDGYNYTERYRLIKDNGQPNDGALNSFSFFARVALNENDLDEIEPEVLVGHFIEARVEQYTYEKDGKNKTGTRLQDKQSSDGWDEPAPVTKGFDLDSFLK